jgi:hypothetical protein
LLNLRPEHQAPFASGNLKPSEATELVRLSSRGQGTLFDAIRAGACRNYNDLRASSTALTNAEARLLLIPDAPPIQRPSAFISPHAPGYAFPISLSAGQTSGD